MKAFRIKIIKSSLDTYWYVGLIGKEFWAEEIITDGETHYRIIFESIHCTHSVVRWVGKADCEVIKESFIKIETITTVVEI
jgi:hypothetical protein